MRLSMKRRSTMPGLLLTMGSALPVAQPNTMTAKEQANLQEHWDYSVKTRGTPTGGAPDGIDYDAVKLNLSPQERKNL